MRGTNYHNFYDLIASVSVLKQRHVKGAICHLRSAPKLAEWTAWQWLRMKPLCPSTMFTAQICINTFNLERMWRSGGQLVQVVNGGNYDFGFIAHNCVLISRWTFQLSQHLLCKFILVEHGFTPDLNYVTSQRKQMTHTAGVKCCDALPWQYFVFRLRLPIKTVRGLEKLRSNSLGWIWFSFF